ncbi:MAG TPA: hypothetical protein ENK81_00950 [Euryarchaeota archaeon]|nr:hypothetical protein [Euryarchaeota archaeon]
MTIAIWSQIRMGDKVIVWEFYKEPDETEHFGSRGLTLTDEELKQLMSISFFELYKARIDGVEIKDKPETLLEKLAKKAYDEYLKAKKQELQRQSETITLET